jgi:CHAT domain-containing protein
MTGRSGHQPVAGAPRAPITHFFRAGLANVENVRRQEPLPETADELCAAARLTGATDATIHLGAAATETNVKALSAQGRLAEARVVHFATHGLLAGEAEAIAAAKGEPALILTPPDEASEEDDGLLTASEVALLKLDADWVILSACNTAAGDATFGAEALSGLARAFFYAGARALLVSHWYVDSDATVALITETFNALHADPALGRAEALRRAMAASIAAGGRAAHPAVWAAFVVVGEGASHQAPPAVRTTVPKLPTKGPQSTAKAKPPSSERDWKASVWKN